MREHAQASDLLYATINVIAAPEGSQRIPLDFHVVHEQKHIPCDAEITWSSTHINVCIVTRDAQHAYISDFRLGVEKAAAKTRLKIIHREVNKHYTHEDKGHSLATETIDIIHALARKLHIHYNYPSEIYINSSRPSLMQFFKKSGYIPESAHTYAVFDEYMREYRERPREDFLKITRNEGSRFLLVRESPRKDLVLVDKHHPQYNPTLFSANEHYVWISEPSIGGRFVHFPYVVRCGFSKRLTI
jgi:hypothetical protein